MRGNVLGWPVLVDWMLEQIRCWWPQVVARELGAYFAICLFVNSGQLANCPFLTAFVQVSIVGENRAAW